MSLNNVLSRFVERVLIVCVTTIITIAIITALPRTYASCPFQVSIQQSRSLFYGLIGFPFPDGWFSTVTFPVSEIVLLLICSIYLLLKCFIYPQICCLLCSLQKSRFFRSQTTCIGSYIPLYLCCIDSGFIYFTVYISLTYCIFNVLCNKIKFI